MLAGTASPLVNACDLCAVYAVTEAQGGSGAGFFGGVAEQFTRFNTLQMDGRDVPNVDHSHINSALSQVFAGYNFNDHIGIQFNLPLIYRQYGDINNHASESGIGDVSLVGNLRLYEKLTEKFTFQWTALGGLKFPTGGSSHLDPAENDFAAGIGGHDLTLGSGSVDGVIGTGFVARRGRVFLTGAVQYAIRTEGSFQYEFANDWIWSGGPGVYLWLGHKHTLSLQAVVSGESKRQDTLAGQIVDDTAITAVNLGPQITYTWSNRLHVQLGVELPVSAVTTDEQLVPDFRIRSAITWRF